VKVVIKDDITIVSGIRSFGYETAQEFAAVVTQRVGDDLPTAVIVDLSETTGIFSAAIVELSSLENVMRKKGGVLVISGLPPAARSMISAGRLDKFFMLAPDVNTALGIIAAERGVG
jgi:anti-anti-sigma regulatory factor